MTSMTRIEYELAVANGMLDMIRREKIEYEVAKKYTTGQEFRIHVEKDINPDAWLEHEEYVANVKAQIDAEIAEAANK